MINLLFIVIWIPLTAVVVLGGGGCPGFILMFLLGSWLASVLDNNSGVENREK